MGPGSRGPLSATSGPRNGASTLAPRWPNRRGRIDLSIKTRIYTNLMLRCPAVASRAKRTALLAALALVACSAPAPERVPLPVTPPGGAPAAVVRRPLPATTPPPAPPIAASPVNPTPAATLAIAAPPGALYVCVTGAGTQLLQTSIEFAPAVGELCRKHPEMGPCQYERDACRRSGGRVFAADGREITRAVEDEYDKRVLRIRLRSN